MGRLYPAVAAGILSALQARRFNRQAHEINWQTVLHRVCDAAGYEDYIYRTSPELELSSEDQAWAKQFVPN